MAIIRPSFPELHAEREKRVCEWIKEQVEVIDKHTIRWSPKLEQYFVEKYGMHEVIPLRPAHENLDNSTNDAAHWLELSFPLFQELLPMRRGIFETVLKLAPAYVSPAGIKNYIKNRAALKEYLEAVIASEHRYDLFSEPCEEITDEERQYSQSLLNQQNPT
jgi:ProQ/FINO family